MKLYPVLLALLITSFWSCDSEPVKFSEETPYAIEIKKSRGYHEAIKIKERLSEHDIDSYIYGLKDGQDNINNWYLLLAGAEVDSVLLHQRLVDYQAKLNLPEPQIINYRTLHDNLYEIEKDSICEVFKIEVKNPDIPSDLYDLLSLFPSDHMFNTFRTNIYNFSDHPRSHFTSFFENKLDLPRGIKRGEVYSNSESFMEVIFQDNLYNDKVTIELIKLKDDHSFRINSKDNTLDFIDNIILDPWQSTTLYFVQTILNTGEYLFEKYSEIEINAGYNLKGYIVKIKLQNNTIRTYFILYNDSLKTLVFSQSTDKEADEIKSYLEGFGRGAGLVDYPSFYNSFFTIPECLEEGDVFLGYNTEILGNDYAREKGYKEWAKAMVGHTSSTAYFYNSVKSTDWTCSAYDLLTPNKRSNIYQGLYSKTNSAKEQFLVKGKLGYYIDASLFGISILRELNFSTTGRHIMAINCVNFNKDDLHKRAVKFQTGYDDPNFNPCEEVLLEPTN